MITTTCTGRADCPTPDDGHHTVGCERLIAVSRREAADQAVIADMIEDRFAHRRTTHVGDYAQEIAEMLVANGIRVERAS